MRHQFGAVELPPLLGVRQGHEFNVPGRPGVVRERALHRIEIVRPDRHQGALPAQIAVELVLQFDEGLVAGLVEGDVPQYRAHHVRPDGVGVGFEDRHGLRSGREHLVLRRVHVPQEHLQAPRDALDAQQVVPVGGHVDLVNDLVAERRQLLLGELDRIGFRGLLPLRRDLVELHAELEGELVELLVGVGPPEVGEEGVAGDADGGHGCSGVVGLVGAAFAKGA